MIAFLLTNADLISAALGLAAAVVLGWPAIISITAKRRYEGTDALTDLVGDDTRSQNAARDIQRHAARYQLGDSKGALQTNLCGYSLLALSFIFLGVASIDRSVQARKPADANSAKSPLSDVKAK